MTTTPSQETHLRVSRDLAVSGRTMAAAKHPGAVHAALDVLDQGGNAVDAAVTAAFAIGVLEPWMSGIGGVGFMTIAGADGRRTVIDYFGRAPQAATADMYELTEGDNRSVVGFGGVRDEANAYGPRSVVVPGMVGGMALALERFGTIGLGRAVAPAAAFADEGFAVDWYRGMLLSSQQATIRRDPETERIFLENGVPPAPLFGQPPPRIVQPELAATLRRIGERGRDGFYRGEVAERIAAHVQAGGGELTADDLARYEPTIVDPLVLRYRDDELLLLPFQAGGVTIGEAFSILAEMDPRATGHNTAVTLHAIAEASRRAHADRLAYVGDPDLVDTDWERLSSAAYAAERRAEIDLARASRPEPGRGIAGDQAGAPGGGSAAKEEGCTTHLCVVDGEGTMVSVTQTLTLIFGSAVTVPGTGVLLNDSMNLFDPVPGRANSIAPGKRPASSMAHVVAVRDGLPILTVGAPGGRRIMDTCLQVTLNALEFGMDPAAACAAPLIDCSGPELLIDDRIPVATRDRLRAMGHDVVAAEVAFSPRAFASPAALAVDPASRLRYGGADPFGGGIAAGR